MAELLKRADSLDRIARLGTVLSDPTRVGILDLLLEKGRATTMDITTTLGAPQPRVSSHLAILLKYGLVSVKGSGRHRVYTVVEPGIGALLRDFEKLAGLSTRRTSRKGRTTTTTTGPSVSPAAAREVKRDTAIRQCRTCYDHLAGVVGIDLLNEMMRRGWLSRKPGAAYENRPLYDLTPLGEKSLRERNVDLGGAYGSKRTFAYGCLDWTERKPHLGGSLGSAVLASILSAGVAKRVPGTRALKLTGPMSSWTDPPKSRSAYSK